MADRQEPLSIMEDRGRLLTRPRRGRSIEPSRAVDLENSPALTPWPLSRCRPRFPVKTYSMFSGPSPGTISVHNPIAEPNRLGHKRIRTLLDLSGALLARSLGHCCVPSPHSVPPRSCLSLAGASS
jgi:hypothetical protein